MAGTVTHQYDIDQSVYVIDSCEETPVVLPGTVLRIRILITATGTTVFYDVRITGNITDVFKEEDVFADKATAITELSSRIP